LVNQSRTDILVRVERAAVIAWEGLAQRVNGDGEFRVASRDWTALLRLDVGGESHRLRFETGELREVAACDRDSPCDVFVSAPREAWDQLLRRVPRPFYQDLFGAALYHDFALNADLAAWAAYYPALRRLVEILRESRQE
jgi:hypothetical protein